MAPLILISQLSRSGGSLFSQLLDGHPQIMLYPHEFSFTAPTKSSWPQIDPDSDPQSLFTALHNAKFDTLAETGYKKGRDFDHRIPFPYRPAVHCERFVAALPAPPRTRRVVMDAYLAGFGAAWETAPAPEAIRLFAGFVPKMASRPRNIQGFLSDYPDGGLVSVIRDPVSWWASRRGHLRHGEVRHGDLDLELKQWNKMAKAAIFYKREYPERFMLLRFDSLVRHRRSVMERFAAWAGVSWTETFLTPTVAGQSIDANTSFSETSDISTAVLRRWENVPPDQAARIREGTSELAHRLEPLFDI